jgi:hypothetical protein
MTPGLVHQFETAVATTKSLAGLTCEQIFTDIQKAGGARYRSAIGDVSQGTVTDVHVAGDSATFKVNISVQGRSLSIPAQAQRISGGWRISCCVGPGPSG